MIGQGSYGKTDQGIYNAEEVVVKVFEDFENEDMSQNHIHEETCISKHSTI